ncbi:MAG: transcription antitermination protein NusB, partial [Bacillota bacterium]
MSRAPRKPREAALEALLRVDGEGATPQSALEAQWAGTETPKRDRALATELVYGSLRRRNALDWVLAKVATRPLAEVQPRLLWVLRLGA